jgi:hypothetical protein
VQGCSTPTTRRSARLVKKRQDAPCVLDFVEPKEHEASEDEMEEDDDMDDFINNGASSEDAGDSAEASLGIGWLSNGLLYEEATPLAILPAQQKSFKNSLQSNKPTFNSHRSRLILPPALIPTPVVASSGEVSRAQHCWRKKMKGASVFSWHSTTQDLACEMLAFGILTPKARPSPSQLGTRPRIQICTKERFKRTFSPRLKLPQAGRW